MCASKSTPYMPYARRRLLLQTAVWAILCGYEMKVRIMATASATVRHGRTMDSYLGADHIHVLLHRVGRRLIPDDGVRRSRVERPLGEVRCHERMERMRLRWLDVGFHYVTKLLRGRRTSSVVDPAVYGLLSLKNIYRKNGQDMSDRQRPFRIWQESAVVAFSPSKQGVPTRYVCNASWRQLKFAT